MGEAAATAQALAAKAPRSAAIEARIGDLAVLHRSPREVQGLVAAEVCRCSSCRRIGKGARPSRTPPSPGSAV